MKKLIVKDSFWGNSDIEKKYKEVMHQIVVQNDGDSDVVVTAEKITFVVKPKESFEETLPQFNDVKVVTNSSFRILVRG
jgi:hypothetical protein